MRLRIFFVSDKPSRLHSVSCAASWRITSATRPSHTQVVRASDRVEVFTVHSTPVRSGGALVGKDATNGFHEFRGGSCQQGQRQHEVPRQNVKALIHRSATYSPIHTRSHTACRPMNNRRRWWSPPPARPAPSLPNWPIRLVRDHLLTKTVLGCRQSSKNRMGFIVVVVSCGMCWCWPLNWSWETIVTH